MLREKYITPICCDKSKNTNVVKLGLYPDKTKYGKWGKIKPRWYILGEEFYRDNLYHIKIEINNCPFCLTQLPDVELNTEINLKITEGDEEYCRTCNERNMVCDCLPPEFRWRIKI